MESPITLHFCCRKCTIDNAKDEDPIELISVGLDKEGTLVVWCDVHDELVGAFPVDTIQKTLEELHKSGCEACRNGAPH